MGSISTFAPVGVMALAPNQKQALVLHQNGVVTKVYLDGQLPPLQSPEPGTVVELAKKEIPANPSAYLGVVFAADSRTAYLSGGDDGAVVVFDTETMKKTDSISLNGPFNGQRFEDSFTSDLTIDRNRSRYFRWRVPAYWGNRPNPVVPP